MKDNKNESTTLNIGHIGFYYDSSNMRIGKSVGIRKA